MISVEPAIEKFHLPPSLDKWRVSSRGREEEEEHWLQWQVSPQGQLSSPPSCYQQQHPGCCVIVLHRTGNIQRFFITLTFSDSKYCEYFWCHCSHWSHQFRDISIVQPRLEVEVEVWCSQVWERGGRGQVLGQTEYWHPPSNLVSTADQLSWYFIPADEGAKDYCFLNQKSISSAQAILSLSLRDCKSSLFLFRLSF